MSRISFALLTLLLLAACTTGPTPPTTTPTVPAATPTATATRASSPTSTATPAAAPQASPTAPPASEPAEIGPGSASLTLPSGLDLWPLADLHDNALPDLMQPGESGFSLDPDWEVAAIDFVYTWWGLAPPVFDFQQVTADGDRYLRAGEDVDAALVENFLAALQGFSVSHSLLSGQSHTDDYPAWTIEITGTDGRSLLLFSSSTGNPGAAPWVAFVDGRFFAQYDGSLAEPIQQLFPTESGNPAGAFFPGGREEGQVVYGSTGWPRQVTEGFTGLLPLAEGFQYRIDREEGTIRGFLLGRSSIGGYGNMIIGRVTGLDAVRLGAAGEESDCLVEPYAIESDVSAAAWTFECPAGDLPEEGLYHLPVSIDFRTDDDQAWSASGALFGYLLPQTPIYLQPLPAELQAVLPAAPALADLLEDHAVGWVGYSAVRNSLNPGQHTLVGEIILLGQWEHEGQPVRYSTSTIFIIENGELTFFALDRDKLEGMLAEIFEEPLLARALDLDPDLTLNLYYQETPSWPAVPPSYGGFRMTFGARTGTCGPQEGGFLPSRTEALRAFSLNGSWFFQGADFVLTADGPVVADLDLWPYRDDRGGLLDLLLPAALNTGNLRPFERIWMQSDTFREEGPELVLWLPEDATDEELATYFAIADQLPGQVDRSFGSLWIVTGLHFSLLEDGAMGIVTCSP